MNRVGVFLGTICMIIFTATWSLAQCTPDPNIPMPGTFPSPIPGGMAGVPYSQTIDIVSIGDTLYLSQLTPFDSIEITIVTAPPGLTYTCASNPVPCMYYPASPGSLVRMCVHLDGTPTQNIGANFILGVELTKWVTVVGQPVALRDTTGISFADPVSLEDHYRNLFENVRLSPNPSSGSIYLSGESFSRSPVVLRVADLQGRNILPMRTLRLRDQFEILVDLTVQPRGIYFIQLISEGRTSTWKAVVE